MTTAQVIQLTHCVDESLIARLFARFRGRYGNLWTNRATCDEDWEFIMLDWLDELSKFSFDQVRAAVNKTLTEFKEYPPTLGQLADLCLRESGVPNPSELMRDMVVRDFNHPMVKMMYDKIGSWTLVNGKEEDISRKVKEYYPSVCSEFHTEPQKAWALLEEYNAKPKELPPPNKIPSKEESLAFRQCMNKCYEILKANKSQARDDILREFDQDKIKKGHKKFDQAVFNDYKKYLLSFSENDVIKLKPSQAYDRMKCLAEIDVSRHLKERGYNPNPQGKDEDVPKRKYGGFKEYKNWVCD